MLLIYAAILAVGAFVLFVQGAFEPFAYWNLVPLGIALMVIKRRTSGAVTSSFAAVVTALVLHFHLAWHFDWWETATASSTSALLFLFAPVYVLVLGLVAAGITKGVVVLLPRLKIPVLPRSQALVFAAVMIITFLGYSVYREVGFTPRARNAGGNAK